MSEPASIVWFRQDLRLDDNPALTAAVERGGPVIPVYIWHPDEEGRWPPGAAGRWWLHQSLKALDADLRSAGSRLILRKGAALDTLKALIRQSGSDAVFWNRRYEPAAIQRDADLKAKLREQGLTVESFNAALLFEPWAIQTKQGRPYQVYTPFSKACLAAEPPEEPWPAPQRIGRPRSVPCSLELEQLELEPTIDWASGLGDAWRPGAHGAVARAERFLDDGLGGYAVRRDQPAEAGTSRLSPHLHFGEISPRWLWHTIRPLTTGGRSHQGAETFIRELLWREFAHHLLYHFPHTTDRPLREQFRAMPWRRSARRLAAWQQGRTGYPIVDAGMRELWATGWMHNRVRMIVASFLVKDLMIPWQDGARWFWDTLVDADLANNTLGWQWSAGCGADAAPFFRIFNPTTQSRKFDPAGAYLRRWLPELAGLSGREIHEPAAAREEHRAAYPCPMVDHAEARARALDAFERVKQQS